MFNDFIFFNSPFANTGYTMPPENEPLVPVTPLASGFSSFAQGINIAAGDYFIGATPPPGYRYPSRVPDQTDESHAQNLLDEPVQSFRIQNFNDFTGVSIRFPTPLPLIDILLLDWVDLVPGDDTMEGTDGDDGLFGGPGNDDIEALAGDDIVGGEDGRDTLRGFAGDDLLDGGKGGDILIGGSGKDLLFGRLGPDLANGGGGSDTAVMGRGNDTVLGGGGADLADGGAGKDRLTGGGGQDSLYGGTGRDTLQGGSGDDTLVGDEGHDLLIGGNGNDVLGTRDPVRGTDEDSGNDTLLGGKGFDFLYGGPGQDYLDAGADDGADAMEGGAGRDTLVASGGAVTEMTGGTLDPESSRNFGDGKADTFRLFWEAGFVKIFDFEPGVDIIELVDTDGQFSDLTLDEAFSFIFPELNARTFTFGDSSATFYPTARNGNPTDAEDIIAAMVIIDPSDL